MAYFNTNKETGETLKNSRTRARSQTDRILDFFRGYRKPLATFQVRKMLFDDSIDKTSVQRAITNLTDLGKLKKHKIDEVSETSPSGKRVHCWQINAEPVAYPCGVSPEPPEQRQLFEATGG